MISEKCMVFVQALTREVKVKVSRLFEPEVKHRARRQKMGAKCQKPSTIKSKSCSSRCECAYHESKQVGFKLTLELLQQDLLLMDKMYPSSSTVTIGWSI